MSISEQIASMISHSSMIREMFEEGERRKKLYGEEKVFDFSIGNPTFEPPSELKAALLELARSDEKGRHRYMPNSGLPETREYMARELSEEHGLDFSKDDIIMATGAAGALNVALKTLLNPGDEVVVFKPYFFEYDSYAANHGGIIKPIESREDFRFDFDELEKSFTAQTKVLIINSPNNPTGAVYPKEDLERLGEFLRQKSKKFGSPVTLISDEIYRKISYDEEAPSAFPYYENMIVTDSSSKDLAIPGERIGYLAISPRHEQRDLLCPGAAIAIRILGFVNAPAMMQRLIPMIGKASVDIAPYKKNRDLLFEHLTGLGFSCPKPGGAFYIFPKTPLGDDMEFIQKAQELNLLMVPGSAFKRAGHFRISYCFDTQIVERSLPVFTKLARICGMA